MVFFSQMKIYPTFSEKHDNYSNNIKFLKFKKLSTQDWKQLNEFEYFTKSVTNNCSSINYSTSLTNDVFYRIILKQNFKLLNFIPFAPRNDFISALFNKFDKNFFQNLEKEIDNRQYNYSIGNDK